VKVVCQQDAARINEMQHQIKVSRKSTYQIANRSKEDVKRAVKLNSLLQFRVLSCNNIIAPRSVMIRLPCNKRLHSYLNIYVN